MAEPGGAGAVVNAVPAAAGAHGHGHVHFPNKVRSMSVFNASILSCVSLYSPKLHSYEILNGSQVSLSSRRDCFGQIKSW